MGWSVGRAMGSIANRGGVVLAVPVAVALAWSLAGCGSSTGSTFSADAGMPTPSVASSATPSSTPSPSVSAPPSPSESAPAVLVDRTLLDVLPPTIDGRPVEEVPDAEAAAAVDPGLGRLAVRFAVGYVASVSKADWAIASVVELRPGAFTDAAYRTWRDTYEAGACAPVGGPAGHAEATIGGRTVDIGTCGSLRIYHVHLGSPDRLVAVTSAGAGDFGERLVAALRP